MMHLVNSLNLHKEEARIQSFHLFKLDFSLFGSLHNSHITAYVMYSYGFTVSLF